MDIDEGARAHQASWEAAWDKYHKDTWEQGKCYTCQQMGHKFFECPQHHTSAHATTTGALGLTAPAVGPSGGSSSLGTSHAPAASGGRGSKADRLAVMRHVMAKLEAESDDTEDF